MIKSKFKRINKLSTLLGVALDDIVMISKNKNYSINMDYWHSEHIAENKAHYYVNGVFGEKTPEEDLTCYVCLAGAIIANSFKENIKHSRYARSYKKDISNRLLAIDSLRKLKILDAVKLIRKVKEVDKIRIIKVLEQVPSILYKSRIKNKAFYEIESFTDFDISVKFYNDLKKILEEEGL